LWKPPLKAWLYELNHEIVVSLVLWNAAVVALAAFTDFCGNNDNNDFDFDEESTSSYNSSSLCDDQWVMDDDVVYNALGVGMFLLLAFRAHEGYDRFWDGRKAWGRVKECCRDLTRQICFQVSISTIKAKQQQDGKEKKDTLEEEEELKLERRRAVAFVGAFASTLKLTLRRERNAVPELGDILCFQDILNIEHANVMPQFCLDVLTHYLVTQQREGRMGEYTLRVMTSTCIAPLADAMGTCERIRNTPIPLSYTLHLRFFVVIWLALYPLHLVAAYGWYAIPLASLIDYAVLGIESMACEIENPFGYRKNCIDLCGFCKGIVADTQEILKRVEHPQAPLVFEGKRMREMNHRRFLLTEQDEGPDQQILRDIMMYNDRTVCRKQERGCLERFCRTKTRRPHHTGYTYIHIIHIILAIIFTLKDSRIAQKYIR
jgi:putative membrane protein